MSKITVTTIAGLTSGADANKVKIESGDTLESSTIGTASGAMSIKPAGTEVVNVGTTGDILVKGTTNQRAALILRAGSNTANSQIQLGDQASDTSGRILYDHSDDTMRFNTNGSERFRVSASGIHIGGTGAANALDDYEEGTWTPVVKATSGGSTYTYSNDYEFRLPGNTSSTTALPYTKIGNRVFITFSIWWNTSATTRYNISLPFAYDGSEYGITGTATPYSISADQGLGILGTSANQASFDTYVITSSGGHGGVPYTSNSEVYYFINYQTA